MNKYYIVAWVVLLSLLASCDLIKQEESEGSSVSQETSTPAADSSIVGEVDEPVVLAQGFVEYDESYVGETENTVLFFHSESCGSCRATEESISETWAGNNTTILKVDYNDSENFELIKKYEVPKYHTFVQVDANGDMIKKWSGSMSAADIAEQIGTDAMMKKDGESMEKMEKDGDVMMEKDDETMMKKEGEDNMMDKSSEGEVMETKELSGVYADYDASLVGQNESTVLAFFAAWCPSCVAADKSLSWAEVPSDLTVLKVDFDSSTDLRKKYGVTSQHTFVQVDGDGNLVKKWVGGTTVDDIVEKVQ